LKGFFGTIDPINPSSMSAGIFNTCNTTSGADGVLAVLECVVEAQEKVCMEYS
jgi:hypothetical protein